jgi:hypothetical protein
MLSFYQRREKCQRQIIAVPSREAEVYSFRIDLLRAAEFSQNNPLPIFKVLTCKPLNRLYFHLSNARQSKSFYDIVFVIDAYRLIQLMTPGG